MLDAPCKFFTLGIIGVVRAVLRKKSESLQETRRMNMNLSIASHWDLECGAFSD